MQSSLCLLQLGDVALENPTFPVLTSALRSDWYTLKWDLVEDSFRRKN